MAPSSRHTPKRVFSICCRLALFCWSVDKKKSRCEREREREQRASAAVVRCTAKQEVARLGPLDAVVAGEHADGPLLLGAPQ